MLYVKLMLMLHLLEKQNQLHKEATELIQNTLLPILSRYGEVKINGSYLYQLLYHPDIDFYVINENASKKIYVELCTELLALDSVEKFKSGDRVGFPHPIGSNRPMGYYVSPTIHSSNNTWTCDIWLQKTAWVNPRIYRYDDTLTNLDDDHRMMILTLKHELIESGQYGVGRRFESVNIYDIVLENPTLNIDEIRNMLYGRD